MSDDLGTRVTRVEERQEVFGRSLDRMERNQERQTENLSRVIWLLGTLGVLLMASQSGVLSVMAKILVP